MVVCWIPECTFRVRTALKDKIGCLGITVLDDTHTAVQELEERSPPTVEMAQSIWHKEMHRRNTNLWVIGTTTLKPWQKAVNFIQTEKP